ncbi:hypothetical protein [Neobacillus drentensis]
MKAAVFGVPDAIWVESVKVAIVLNEGHKASEEELI